MPSRRPVLALRATVLALAVALAAATLPAAAPAPHPTLARGIALLGEGDFEAAVLALDAAVRALSSDPAPAASTALPMGFVYLGVAYLELDQEPTAKSKFREALARDPALQLDASQFSGQTLRVFEVVRAERPPSAARPVSRRPSPAVASPSPEGKGRSPVLWIAGAGAAAAGVAVALGGGGGGAPTTTDGTAGTPTTTVPGSVPPSADPPTPMPSDPTTTTTAPGGPPTTSPGTPTTTTPTATTTTTSTTPTTTTTTTTTQPPACNYTVGNSDPAAFGPLGGNGSCSVTTTAACTWRAEDDQGWISLSNDRGTGSGTITFSVQANTGSARSGRISLVQAPSVGCTVLQAAVLFAEDRSSPERVQWTSTLEIPGATGQVVLDGALAGVAGPGVAYGTVPREGGRAHRLEAVLVEGATRSGLWRFQFAGPIVPGSLRALAGEVAAQTTDTLAFRLQGRPGERVVLTFRTR